MRQPLIRLIISVGLTLLFGYFKKQQVGRVRRVAVAWSAVLATIDYAGLDDEVTLKESEDIQTAIEYAIEATREMLR